MLVFIESFEFCLLDFKKYRGSDGGLRTDVGWMILPSHHFKSEEMRVAYGKWYRVRSVSGLTFNRQISFSPTLKKSEVLVDRFVFNQIDHEQRANDGIQTLEIRRARGWEILQAWVQHPDAGIRASTVLGLLGAILGILSLFLAIMGFMKGF